MKEGCARGSVGFLEKLRGGYCVKRGLNVCIRPGRAELMEERWAVGELNFHLIGKGTE